MENNDQLIERFEKWLLICGKAESTRINYRVAVTQFSKFLVNKPLTAATKEDVRAFIFQSIRPRFSRYHDAGETGCAADSV